MRFTYLFFLSLRERTGVGRAISYTNFLRKSSQTITEYRNGKEGVLGGKMMKINANIEQKFKLFF